MASKVFIGVGHGGKDPGAVANGFEEADLNLQIALACQKELVRHGVIVGISRTKDENDELTEEIRDLSQTLLLIFIIMLVVVMEWRYSILKDMQVMMFLQRMFLMQ